MHLKNFFQAPKLVQPIFVLFSSSPHHFSSISGCIVTQFAGPLGGLPSSPVVLPPLIISPSPFLLLPRQKVVFDAPDLAPFLSAVHSLWLDGHVKLLLLPPGGKRKKATLVRVHVKDKRLKRRLLACEMRVGRKRLPRKTMMREKIRFVFLLLLLPFSTLSRGRETGTDTNSGAKWKRR